MAGSLHRLILLGWSEIDCTFFWNRSNLQRVIHDLHDFSVRLDTRSKIKKDKYLVVSSTL